ncbi:hypothetical protein X798_01056 [Onchocerca flexuosa]|uniref:Uncharacterized protein n=1 Tax=Onchocerca flexuosa TaxID=387005 RepID=A0A238C404_9BILA|nr:hypothetical protein X798_01056 [Onchocerca flexuosa]
MNEVDKIKRQTMLQSFDNDSDNDGDGSDRGVKGDRYQQSLTVAGSARMRADDLQLAELPAALEDDLHSFSLEQYWDLCLKRFATFRGHPGVNRPRALHPAT